MSFNLTTRTNILLFLVSLFVFSILTYSLTIWYPIFVNLDIFLLKTLEALIGAIFLVTNISGASKDDPKEADQPKIVAEAKKDTNV
jgi:hypothetical protein